MSQESNLQEEWGAGPSRQVTTEELDQLVKQVVAMRAEYDRLKAVASEANQKVEEAEKVLMGTLKAAGKSKYECEGVALVNLVTKENWTTPKEVEDKRMLYEYIKKKYSDDVLVKMTSINYQTLNSWAKAEIEIHVADPSFKIPGIGNPTSTEVLSLRKR